MESTNQKLKVLIEQHKADPNLRVDPVGMVLNGVVDAAVSGGIANYKVCEANRPHLFIIQVKGIVLTIQTIGCALLGLIPTTKLFLDDIPVFIKQLLWVWTESSLSLSDVSEMVI